MNGQTVEITQEFLYYSGFNGDNKDENDWASGAYIFRPIDNTATVVADSVTVSSVTGDLVIKNSTIGLVKLFEYTKKKDIIISNLTGLLVLLKCTYLRYFSHQKHYKFSFLQRY